MKAIFETNTSRCEVEVRKLQPAVPSSLDALILSALDELPLAELDQLSIGE